MICEACQRDVQVGDWPFCPHPHGYAVSVIDDTLEGGPRWFETLGPEPVFIESKSQWRREVAARPIEHVDRHDRDYYRRLFRQHDERLRDEAPRQ
jgi:hypothetical protein